MTFTIRLASAADVPAMHRIRRAVRENALTDPARVTEASYAPYIAAGAAWIAAAANGDIAGFVALDRGDASVWALFVAPGHEGAGVGQALLDTLVGDAARHGVGELWVTTAADTRAERFYRKAGWLAAPVANAGETLFRKALNQ